MDELGLNAVSASLPGVVLYPTTLLLVLLMLVVLIRQRRTIVKFAVFAPWIRYMASFYHQFTFLPLVAGFSTNALISSSMFVVGLAFVKRKHLFLKLLLPCYVVMFVVILSGLANHAYGGTIDTVVKFGYFVVISLAVFEALGTVGERRMSVLLLWAFLAPAVFQMLSIALGVKKASENDGSASFIGGYNHESAFSIILATCMIIASFASGLKRPARIAIFFGCLAGILLANYRTTILAMLPVVVVGFNKELLAPFRRSHRPILVIGTLIVSVIGLLVAAWLLRDRFDSLIQAFQPWDRLMKPQYEYSEADKQLLSARGYIWSGYIYGYLDGTAKNHLIGFGPNSWRLVFDVYAHNTLISALYEYGPPGVLSMILLWMTMLMAAIRVRHGPRISLVAAHLGFLILNMATMPHFMIEGDILYGIICGYTFHWRLRSAEAKVPAAAQPMSRRGPVPVGSAART